MCEILSDTKCSALCTRERGKWLLLVGGPHGARLAWSVWEGVAEPPVADLDAQLGVLGFVREAAWQRVAPLDRFVWVHQAAPVPGWAVPPSPQG